MREIREIQVKSELFEFLRCPDDSGELDIRCNGGSPSQALICTVCGTSFPIVSDIPRFVKSENYANNFGFQWKKFQKTQLDSFSGVSVSRDRFYQQIRLKPADLKGKTVLDVGCGAGRFTEVALDAGATVYAIDFSSAVDACWANHRASGNLCVVQADIYRLPFAENHFDYIYCFGVLQHTPNVREAFLSLPYFLKPGGRLSVDIYLRRWHRRFHPKRILRPLTRRIEKQKLFSIVERVVPPLLALNGGLRMIPVIGKRMTRFVPVADYTGLYGLNRHQVKEWAVLDTFDWLSPAYDSSQTPAKLKEWMEYAKLGDIEVEVPGFIVGRGTKVV